MLFITHYSVFFFENVCMCICVCSSEGEWEGGRMGGKGDLSMCNLKKIFCKKL